MHNQLVLKKWRSFNSSYVFIGKWCKDFMKRRNLQEGYEIAMYCDTYYSRFNFRILNRN
ncbi:hypothetical protein Pint_15453 [Pistacia integerrima]|uniref:Uncharacterized protein n=1 Tax=Pistacia integerrima TaxID=434235 RepID=A0ACC0ZCJ6_9ROSI|nr:hypothetical protein Pint_15453 [Pistacia integerrima]